MLGYYLGTSSFDYFSLGMEGLRGAASFSLSQGTFLFDKLFFS